MCNLKGKVALVAFHYKIIELQSSILKLSLNLCNSNVPVFIYVGAEETASSFVTKVITWYGE